MHFVLPTSTASNVSAFLANNMDEDTGLKPEDLPVSSRVLEVVYNFQHVELYVLVKHTAHIGF